MIILGIDPGSRKTGYAFVEATGKKIIYLDSGVIRFDDKKLFLDRIGDFHGKIKALVDLYSIDAIALESLIYVKSPTALIKLAQARGAMLAALHGTHAGKIFEYAPNEIKSVAAGYGHADKLSVQKAISMIVGKREYQTDDESDAVAVAICHALNGSKNSNRNLNKIPRGKARASSSLGSSLSHAVKNI